MLNQSCLVLSNVAIITNSFKKVGISKESQQNQIVGTDNFFRTTSRKLKPALDGIMDVLLDVLLLHMTDSNDPQPRIRIFMS